MDSVFALPVDPSGRLSSVDARVLIVDDDADTRDVLSLFLTDEGYDVYSAGSGAEAIALMASMPEPPDIALVDIVMPEMNGFEVIEEMRRTPRLANVPVAVISGHPPETYGEPEVAVWLVKPPSVVELLSAVARLTGK